ncbi:hypothetical protein BER2_2263 [plant metagenome]|uniref:Uncharacterized protein n=1 Tax=plant metagenome TaxID=1297885 RepID=A0A484TC19_9ZZZZ
MSRREGNGNAFQSFCASRRPGGILAFASSRSREMRQTLIC